MAGRAHSTRWVGKSHNREAVYRVEDMYKLRDTTPIGSIIEFQVEDSIATDKGGYKKIKNTIKGTVTAKFPQVFVLDKKCTYTWKDYLMGKME